MYAVAEKVTSQCAGRVAGPPGGGETGAGFPLPLSGDGQNRRSLPAGASAVWNLTQTLIGLGTGAAPRLPLIGLPPRSL
jgi:hypothetical protein